MDNGKDRSWFVDVNNVRTEYIKIENLKQFKAPTPPRIHPDHPDYVDFWSRESKKCIEGIWGKEWGKYRYMPGKLYFLNYTIIQHTIEEQKLTLDIKPLIVDYYWDFAYMSLVAYGFSGFTKDEEYTACIAVDDYNKGRISKQYLPKEAFNSKGEVKTFIAPLEYIAKLHNTPMGKASFSNPTMNVMVFGSRGGGKSYWVALAELEYNYIFKGAKVYDNNYINNLLRAEQCVGSADTNKSSELLTKFKISQDAKANGENKQFREWFGIWGNPGEDDFTPCPFYMRSSGNLNCPNKQSTKTFRHEYKVEVNGEWKPKGPYAKVFHVNYSTKKGDGEQAGVGGRYLFTNVEEVGLTENIVGVLGANEGTISRGGTRFGVQWCQGTSGNIEYVQGAKKVFLNPQSYKIISYLNKNGNEGKNGRTGYFIPYYITLFKYKDDNGNTDFEAAIADVNRQREELSHSDDPEVLRTFLMNKPCYTQEMWLTDQGYYLPYEEAASRERELTKFDYYRELQVPVELVWDSNQRTGVNYKIRHDVTPFTEFPIPKDLKDPSGSVVIYEFPEENHPHDLYCFIGHDPYVEEDIERGGSLGVTYVLKNPAYISSGHTGNIIVASYIGKPIKGLDYYYEQQEKLLALYGNPQQGLWYEKNRGDWCRNYYLRRQKLGLLCLTPQRAQGANIYQRNITSTGFFVGGNGSLSKKNLLKMTRDWLLEETTFIVNGKEESKRNIERIPCLFLVRQIMQFNIKDNFDAVSAFIGCVLGLKEYESGIEPEKEKNRQNELNSMRGLLNNSKIFSNDYIRRSKNPHRLN